MLSMDKYTREYIDQCRSRVELQVSGSQALVVAARAGAGSKKPQLDAALATFEP